MTVPMTGDKQIPKLASNMARLGLRGIGHLTNLLIYPQERGILQRSLSLAISRGRSGGSVNGAAGKGVHERASTS
jgi:hypothetical protein